MTNQNEIQNYEGYYAIGYVIGSGSGDPVSIPSLDVHELGHSEDWEKCNPDINEITGQMEALDPKAHWCPDDVVAYFRRDLNDMAAEVIAVFNW